jgi:hypothetical protein
MNNNTEKIKEYLVHRWQGTSVRFAYIFGSSIVGHGWKTVKDIDIAVWLSPGYKLEEGERLREELEKYMDVPIDVVVVNEAPLMLQYEVLRNGRLIYCSDHTERVEREVKILLAYYDLELTRKHLASEITRMIEEGSF